MKPQKFKLPCTSESFANLDRKTLIVSVFGKSQYRAKACKAEMFSSVLQVNLLEEPEIDKDSLCEIEGYHDPKTRTVYLHLKGLLDTHALINEYDQFIEKQKRKDFLSAWAHMRHKYCKGLLVLLHISHVVILSHPTHNFDHSYIQLFRAIEIIRQKTLPQLSDFLSTISGLPKDWLSNGRPCSPRVLFYFETCPPIFRDPDSGASIKKLEHALEDKIYQILRKNRIVTNISSNSLFAIPANQEFVFVNTGNSDTRDILAYMTQQLIKSCAVNPGASGSKNLGNFDALSSDESEDESYNFKKFLQQHINLAFSKGFDDNVGRHQVPAHFEIPTLALFFEVANKVHEFFVGGADKELSSLHGLLDTDVKFSKSRCTKVLPRALQAYQENLPQHYTRSYHESKLAHAMGVFEMHARGPLFEEFSEKLQEECEKHWRTGRQMCQVLSLTGNPCTNPIHKGGGEGAGGGESLEDREDFYDLSSMEHCSGVRYICACNCGRSQGSREDPFKLKQANYDYFHILSMQCGCNQLESYRFPVFQPSIHNYRAAQFPTNRKDSIVRTDVSTPQDQTQVYSLGVNDEFKDEITAYGSGGQSPPAQSDLVEEDATRLSDKTSFTPGDENKIVIAVSDADSENCKEKSIKRQPSTTEYLPGMLHTESPAGLLPQFSSWSLVCLGSSSIYSHNLGLQHQSGVLANSAFLLPWDVTVRLEHQKDRSSLWPGVENNQHSFNPRGKNFQSVNVIRGRKVKKGKELLVKIFVGVEYECPRGHRFMAATPDKVLKATGIGTVKDNGNKVTSSTADMPLYFPCPCRQPKPLIAQLMRIHVVTPKAPVHVTLNPRVQPGPPPCPIFVTGCEEPIKLSQSAYWILRLPYVYMGEKGPYLPPKEPVSVSHGRLLAGMYGISEVVSDKK
ncbi:protein SMG8 [Copidosoma floridanum]|uniref:protein SMG8 n=1 Tax=Copidosoma floridanum TaxID=29053 RepID=UPI0006C9D78D|nr:protein SMG8 [Copidosoma floridanum]